MKISCCNPDANVPHFNTPTTRFDSQQALVTLENCCNFKQLKQVHGRIIRSGLTHDQVLLRKLLQHSCAYGKMNYASLVFDQINAPDSFTWNVMIRGCTLSGSPEHALVLFKEMLLKGFAPDKFTYPFVIKACIASNAFDFGRAVHALAIKMRFWGDTYVQNTMMNFYFKCGNEEDGCKVFDKMRGCSVVSWTTLIAGLIACGKVDRAREVFDEMPSKNVVSWTAMIDGYVKCQRPVEAFDLFEGMQIENVRPNEFTLVSLVSACTEMGSLKLGKWIHDYAIKNGIELGPFLGTALIDMYSKCGSLDDAWIVFGIMTERNLATWNTMITSLGVHGLSEEALDLFKEMEKANVVPDAVTFVGVLSACVHMHDVEEGERYFSLMTEHYGISPILEHYVCMVELYTGDSELDEVYTSEEAMSLSMKTNQNVVELLQESKLTSVDDIKEVINKHYGDLNFSKLDLDHSSVSSVPETQELHASR
ncbi:pentatricopeptide repeat-containing protein At3g26630, chloroplastic [Lotus japonicus]|uniref:pentatricopeptide repeat-containing protein At3g26630, chloroplastic n=1 Tax=Lotus japonicus TaxID=34305 RepID=UPI00258C55C4|nr:pentatricopeptide repeat-containing protein At3g26630, chloroplastic [Lotus japonicus]